MFDFRTYGWKALCIAHRCWRVPCVSVDAEGVIKCSLINMMRICWLIIKPNDDSSASSGCCTSMMINLEMSIQGATETFSVDNYMQKETPTCSEFYLVVWLCSGTLALPCPSMCVHEKAGELSSRYTLCEEQGWHHSQQKSHSLGQTEKKEVLFGRQVAKRLAEGAGRIGQVKAAQLTLAGL